MLCLLLALEILKNQLAAQEHRSTDRGSASWNRYTHEIRAQFLQFVRCTQASPACGAIVGATPGGSSSPEVPEAGTFRLPSRRLAGLKSCPFNKMSEIEADLQSSHSSSLLLVTTVELGGGRTGTVEVRAGDDPLDVARQFCAYHGLPDTVVAPLALHLQENLELESSRVRRCGRLL